MDINQIRDLLQRYQAGNCTPSENELIEHWYQQLVETGEWQWGPTEKKRLQQMMEARIMKRINNKSGKIKSPVLRLLRNRWWAAASVILLIGTLSYFMFFNKPAKPELIAKTLPGDVRAPQSNRAMITLANGQKIFLDSVANGALAVQRNVKLVKLSNGKIAYQKDADEIAGKMEFNTLSNPRGSKVINMTLSDGSKVWLNAGSSLTYPVAFIGNERKVAVSGEAYFEVAHDASKPFTVSNGTTDVRVLGTHFNVNTFEDDGHDVEVTLLEGSVKINNGSSTGILKPGQQARIDKEVKIVNNVNLKMVMAWKNGYFEFDNANLQSVLKQISRWYDVDVVYEGAIPNTHFGGIIDRGVYLSNIINVLNKYGIKLKLEDKKLIISPK